MTPTELAGAAIAAFIGLHTAALIAVIVLVSRMREKVTRLEEWARLEEKRRNGA